MRTLLLAAICVSTCLANTTVPSLKAGRGCFGDDGSCFYYENREKLNWDDAEDACQQSGGHLAALTSKEETVSFLEWANELLFSEDKAWIGLNSVGLDGSFQWVDGRLVDYTNWEKAQTVYAQHACVYVTKTGTWDVGDCKEHRVAICRTTVPTTMTIPITSSTSNSTTPFQGYCSKGSYTFGEEEEKCYQPFASKLSWSGAEKACRANGQELVSVHNMEEQEFLTALLGKMNTSVWIGLKKSPQEELYRWADASEFDFSNWAPRQPSDQQMCVEMLGNSKQGGKWNDRSCEQKQGYICQKNRDPTISTTMAPSRKCETTNATFYEYLDSCYRVFFNESLSWSEAQSHCEQYGGSLTSITNAHELAFLSLLRRYNHQDDLWIGLSAVEAKKGLFEWEDHWPVLISEWQMGEPVLDDSSNRTCVALTIDNKWTVKNCEDRNDFICKFTEVAPPHVPKPDGKCPNPEDTRVEWTNIGNDHCYYVNRDSLRSWGDASKVCTRLYPGARLASFHSNEELKELHKISNFNETFWIGLAQGLNGFQWSDQSPVDFVSWETNPKSGSNCVALNGTTSKWKSVDCNTNRGFICMVDREQETTSTEITTVTEYPRICGPPASGWVYFDDNCYKAYSNWQKSFSWESADDFCKGQKSELASIHSKDENAFIIKQLKDNADFARDDDYWLGMYRPRRVEAFFWSDESIVDFTNVPYTKSEEEMQCVSIHQQTGKWNKTSCSNPNGLVCKKPYIPTVVTTTPSGTSTEYPGFCDIGWTRLGNKCFMIFNDEPLNWTMARETCKEKYDDLLAIHNKHEEMVITSLLESYMENGSLWIGLRRIMQEQFEWSDGTEMNFAYWGAGEPSGTQEKCVTMETSSVRAGKWRNSMCREKRGYICQNHPSKTVTTSTPEYDNRTDEGFVKYGSADYKFELNVTKASNWREAEIACAQFGGHLASINNPYEQAFIYTQLDSVTDIDGLWIGLADLGENGVFNWTDNWPIFFTDWANDEPRHPSHNTRCVYLDLKTEEWRSGDCLESKGYICKVTDKKPPPMPEVNNGTCPEQSQNWTDVGTDYCYYISPSADKDLALTWPEASLYCKQRGAMLASIHSHEELDLLVPYFRDATRAMWIGLLKKFHGGFDWVDNTAVNFVHWGAGYPTEKENCVSMSQYNIGWRDSDCQSEFGFLCKVMKENPMTTSEPTVTTDNSTTNTSDTTITEPVTSSNGTDTSSSESTTEMSSSSSATTGTGPDPEQKTGLGGGGIAGIVIGCLAAVALVAGGAFFYMRRRRSEEELLINDHSSP